MTDNSNSLTKEELGKHLNLNVSWINQHLDEIPHFKIHRLVRFNLGEVKSWLRKFKKGEKVRSKYSQISPELTIDITRRIANCEKEARIIFYKKLIDTIKIGPPFPKDYFASDVNPEYEAICFLFGRVPTKEELEQLIDYFVEAWNEETRND